MSDSWRPQQDRLDRIARHQLSMIPGAVHGRVAEASPVKGRERQESGGDDEIEVIFSYAGVPAVGDESPPYMNRLANADIVSISIATRSSPGSTSTLSLMCNGSSVAQISLPAGQHSAELNIDGTAEYGDLLSVVFTEADINLDGVTIQVSLAE